MYFPVFLYGLNSPDCIYYGSGSMKFFYAELKATEECELHVL